MEPGALRGKIPPIRGVGGRERERGSGRGREKEGEGERDCARERGRECAREKGRERCADAWFYSFGGFSPCAPGWRG